MSPDLKRAITYAGILMATFALLAALPGCTFVRYEDEARKLTVVDLHPGGESITINGVADDKGSLDINRETGSSTEAIGATTGLVQ